MPQHPSHPSPLASHTPGRARTALVALALSALALASQAFDLQGHRGIRGLAPENTIASFELAIAKGATTLETDAQITADGVIVLHHDLALNPVHTRDKNGQWLTESPVPIFKMNLAELFELVRRPGNTHVRMAIETKLNPLLPDATQAPEPFATALVKAVREAGLQQRVQIMSFDWRTLQVVQRIAPEIPTVYLTAQQKWMDNIGTPGGPDSPWTAGFQIREHGSVPRMIKAAGGQYWSVYHGDIDATKVKEAQALGLKVLVWTVNEPGHMGRIVDLGVDGLITDRADLAMPVLKQRGITPR